MAKNLYYAWATPPDATEAIIFGKFTNKQEAARACKTAPHGYTGHVEQIWIDGDGASWNSAYNREVMTFKIR